MDTGTLHHCFLRVTNAWRARLFGARNSTGLKVLKARSDAHFYTKGRYGSGPGFVHIDTSKGEEATMFTDPSPLRREPSLASYLEVARLSAKYVQRF
jgi:hypothetical protein